MEKHTHSPRFDVDASAHTLPSDLAQQTLLMVNVAYVGEPGGDEWTLVDAGIPGMASRILATAGERFGGAPPRAIILTHGHFDHVGSLHALLAAWPDVKVYAHRLELPYLTGKSSYPPPDPTVGGGILARSAPLFPKGPDDFGDRIEALPEDHSVPSLPDWRWIATPGHSPGHVSFFRERDRALIVGDAFITQKQESLVGVLTAATDLRGPPMYFTPDWKNARTSVNDLAALRPACAITGHGHALVGADVAESVAMIAREFDARSLPKTGRYLKTAAVADENGVVSVPAKPTDNFTKLAIVGGVMAIGAAALVIAHRQRRASGECPVATRVKS